MPFDGKQHEGRTGMAQVNVYVPEELKARLERADDLPVSKIAQRAWERELTRREMAAEMNATISNTRRDLFEHGLAEVTVRSEENGSQVMAVCPDAFVGTDEFKLWLNKLTELLPRFVPHTMLPQVAAEEQTDAL